MEIIESNKKKKTPALPQGVRAVVYSFIPFKDLLDKIALLSQSEKDYISDSEVLDQPKPLKMTFDGVHYISFTSLKYCLTLCTSANLTIKSFDKHECYTLETILELFPTKLNKDKIDIIWDEKMNRDLLNKVMKRYEKYDLKLFLYVGNKGCKHIHNLYFM